MKKDTVKKPHVKKDTKIKKMKKATKYICHM